MRTVLFCYSFVLTEFPILKWTTIGDHNLLCGLARLRAVRFDLLDNIQALNNFAKDNVLVIQPGGLHRANEELRAVGIGASVGHWEDAGSGVLQAEVLIGELVAIDGLASSAIVIGEIAALAHEVWNDAMETGALIAEALLAGAQGTEILGCFGHDIRAQLKYEQRE